MFLICLVQVKFYNAQTVNMSKAAVVSYIANFATQVVADSLKSAVVSGFENTQTDLKTRVSFKVSLGSVYQFNSQFS